MLAARPPMHGAAARATVLEMHFLFNGGEEIFAAEEQVTVTWEPLGIEQLAAIWQVAPMSRQPSGSFVARFALG